MNINSKRHSINEPFGFSLSSKVNSIIVRLCSLTIFNNYVTMLKHLLVFTNWVSGYNRSA